MSQYSKAQYKALYGSTGTVFPDNTTEEISEGDMRQFGEDGADSFMSINDNAYNMFGATASGTDTYTATLSPSISAYSSDHRYYIKFTNANTGAATLNLNTLGAKSIVKNGSTALAAGNIAAGQILVLAYDGTNLQIIGNVGGSGGTISGLTTNRIPYATGSTTLGDDSALTWDATNNALTVNSARIHTSNHADNVFVGNGAGNFTNSLFGSNIGIGSNALDALTTGNSNIGIGKDALGAHQTGSGNVAIGVNALAAVVSTISNVAIGAGALSITTGSRNIAIGLNAGDNITTASNAVIIGDQLDAPSATTDGQLSIQNIIFGTGNTATGTTVSTGNIGIGVAAPAAKLDVTEDTVGSAAFKVSSSATNDDPGFTIYQNRVTTTDATVTTIHTVAIPATTTVAINGWVVARRTGGSSGTAEDGAAYEFKAVYKNVSGTATIIGASTITAIGEDQAGWDVTLVPSSSNVLIRVTGDANNNITWHLSELKLMSVGS